MTKKIKDLEKSLECADKDIKCLNKDIKILNKKLEEKEAEAESPIWAKKAKVDEELYVG